MAILNDSFIILFRLKAPYQFTMLVYLQYNPDSYWHPFIYVQYGDEVPQVCIHLHQKLHYNSLWTFSINAFKLPCQFTRQQSFNFDQIQNKLTVIEQITFWRQLIDELMPGAGQHLHPQMHVFVVKKPPSTQE